MLRNIQFIVILNSFIAFAFSDILITEITDPQNSSDAGRYVELYNNGSASIDLSSGWALQRWTNANSDPQSPRALGGTIEPGGYYIVCNNSDKFSATYGFDCDEDIGTGGAADSNGDDNIALLNPDGSIYDMFGVAGEDGSGTGHEFEDGRAERIEGCDIASDVWDEACWNIDNDSGGGNGNQYAPEGYDPGSWIGAGSSNDDGGEFVCDDTSACNYQEEAPCFYPSGCDEQCGSDLEFDDCGVCGGDGLSCIDPISNLFFSEHAEGSSNNKYFEVYNASESEVNLDNYTFVSCSNGCTEWEYTTSFAEGAIIGAGEVYVVCHSSADEIIIPSCNETRALYHNGDDAQGLIYTPDNTLLDIIGIIGDDPGSGWVVAGIENGTKDHTLVRKTSVAQGNFGDWASSAGTNSEDSEWVVLDQDVWGNLGWHDCEACDGGGNQQDACDSGDVTGDGYVDVLDVVRIVGLVLTQLTVDEVPFDCADFNDDLSVDVLDVVAIVNSILSGTARSIEATSATLFQSNNSLSFSANGLVGAIQLVISHDQNFEITLNSDAFLAQSHTEDNRTHIMILYPNSDHLFESNGTFVVEEVKVVNSSDRISVTQVSQFGLNSAYPNPFNPSTTLDISVIQNGLLNLSVYDLSGKLISEIMNGELDPGNYSFTWHASNFPSGMYLVRASMGNESSLQKVILLK